MNSLPNSLSLRQVGELTAVTPHTSTQGQVVKRVHRLQTPVMQSLAAGVAMGAHVVPHIEVSAQISGTPTHVLAILRDYYAVYQARIPLGYFKEIEVEEGGVGAGTVYHATVSVMGMICHFYVDVTEPEPGVIVHTDRYTGLLTTITVLDEGATTRVTWATSWPEKLRRARGLVPEQVERMAALLRRVYQGEAVLLQEAVRMGHLLDM